MTEEEAKGKLCCGPEGCGYLMDVAQQALNAALSSQHARTTLQMLPSMQRPVRYCAGSVCMAWQWVDATTPHLNDRDELGGYCGLAGRQG